MVYNDDDDYGNGTVIDVHIVDDNNTVVSLKDQKEEMEEKLKRMRRMIGLVDMIGLKEMKVRE